MADVHWTSQAIADLDAIASYIAQFDPVAAAVTVDRLYALGDSLCDFPRRGRLASDGTRALVTVPPYVLHYDVSGDVVAILTIRHGRQDRA